MTRGSIYYRPIPGRGPARPAQALTLAGGACWFDHVERLGRDAAPVILPVTQVPAPVLARMTAPRAPVMGLALDRPRIMGIVNVTPDSFSDGGRYDSDTAALDHGRALAAAGADLLDIGGESTRPGAAPVPTEAEIARTAPVIAGLRGLAPVSIDTRNAPVARAAVAAGAGLINDVSGLEHDPAMAGLAAELGVPVCIMHAQGTPETMQDDPRYDDVLLDIYDYLEAGIARAEAAGIPRAAVLVDPGIGFGKTVQHNLDLLYRISLFHSLGCAILVGASRKRFIGSLTGTTQATDRVAGSVAVALAMAGQGVQVIRVHDVVETHQALILDRAMTGGVDRVRN